MQNEPNPNANFHFLFQLSSRPNKQTPTDTERCSFCLPGSFLLPSKNVNMLSHCCGKAFWSGSARGNRLTDRNLQPVCVKQRPLGLNYPPTPISDDLRQPPSVSVCVDGPSKEILAAARHQLRRGGEFWFPSAFRHEWAHSGRPVVVNSICLSRSNRASRLGSLRALLQSNKQRL